MKHLLNQLMHLLVPFKFWLIFRTSNCISAIMLGTFLMPHPLFTEDMNVYSDSKVSDFLHSITEDQCVEFLNEWNGSRDHREKIYISYDSTNKACQAGDIETVEYGHPKVDQGLPIFNYAVAYDTNNSEPLFYDKYPGSINDVSQLEFMLETAYGYGYSKVGFIGYSKFLRVNHFEGLV